MKNYYMPNKSQMLSAVKGDDRYVPKSGLFYSIVGALICVLVIGLWFIVLAAISL